MDKQFLNVPLQRFVHLFLYFDMIAGLGYIWKLYEQLSNCCCFPLHFLKATCEFLKIIFICNTLVLKKYSQYT